MMVGDSSVDMQTARNAQREILRRDVRLPARDAGRPCRRICWWTAWRIWPIGYWRPWEIRAARVSPEFDLLFAVR